MFTYEEESRRHWFNPAAPTDPESLARFSLFGAALGLAIYNGVILDVHLPPVAYRRLVGCRPTLADLTELSPSLGRGGVGTFHNRHVILQSTHGSVDDSR
jgi:hypothetical protein